MDEFLYDRPDYEECMSQRNMLRHASMILIGIVIFLGFHYLRLLTDHDELKNRFTGHNYVVTFSQGVDNTFIGIRQDNSKDIHFITLPNSSIVIDTSDKVNTFEVVYPRKPAKMIKPTDTLYIVIPSSREDPDDLEGWCSIRRHMWNQTK